MSADLRLGIVGLGLRSGALGPHAHRPARGARIVAVSDPHQARRQAARDRYGPGVLAAADFRELLDADLDAVLVLTPDPTHEEIAVAFLERGATVFLEKPMAITVDSCDRILEAAARSGGRLYVGHNMRHMPVILAMRALIADGAIGDVKAIWCRHFVGHGADFYFKDWHADRRNSTGLLLQKGVHDIDVIHWLAGGYTTRVNAIGALAVYGAVEDRCDRSDQTLDDWYDPARNWPPLANRGLNPVIDVEDISQVNMLLANGTLASYQQCHFTPDYWRNYTVIGTAGRLENFGDTDGATIKVWNRRGDYRPDADLVVEVPAAPSDDGEPGAGHGGADQRLVEEFLGFARGDRSAGISPLSARYAVATACAATDSLRADGRPVDVAPAAPDLARHFMPGSTAGRDRSGARR